MSDRCTCISNMKSDLSYPLLLTSTEWCGLFLAFSVTLYSTDKYHIIKNLLHSEWVTFAFSMKFTFTFLYHLRSQTEILWYLSRTKQFCFGLITYIVQLSQERYETLLRPGFSLYTHNCRLPCAQYFGWEVPLLCSCSVVTHHCSTILWMVLGHHLLRTVT